MGENDSISVKTRDASAIRRPIFDTRRIGAAVCGLALLGLAACESDSLTQEPLTYSNPADPSGPPVTSPDPRATSAPGPTTNAGLYYTGDPEMEKYVQKFVDDGKAEGVDVTPGLSRLKFEIRIQSLDQWGVYVIGLCEYGYDSSLGRSIRRVTFDPEYWNTATETQRELVAHHEFAHCALNRGHRTDLLASGAYASIMYPQIMGSRTYTADASYYLNELFTWNAQPTEDASAAGVQVHVCDHDGS